MRGYKAKKMRSIMRALGDEPTQKGDLQLDPSTARFYFLIKLQTVSPQGVITRGTQLVRSRTSTLAGAPKLPVHCMTATLAYDFESGRRQLKSFKREARYGDTR